MADPARQMSKFQGNWPKSRQFRIETDVMEGAIFFWYSLTFECGNSQRHQQKSKGDIPTQMMSREFGRSGAVPEDASRAVSGGPGRLGLMVPSGVQNAQYIWNLAQTGQMRGHFEKTRFDLYLAESRSQWPNFGYGSKGHLYASY